MMPLPRKRRAASLLFLSLFLASLAFATPVVPGLGVTFSSVDYTPLGGGPLTHGEVFVDYTTIGAGFGSSGFINVVLPSGAWLAQNIPVNLASGYPGLSMMFDFGSVPGSFANVYVDFSASPLLNAPSGAPSAFALTSIEYNAGGRNGPAVPPVLPPPLPPGQTLFDAIGQTLIQFVTGHGQPAEQDTNQCGPGALSNSLEYLKNKGVPVRHQNVAGTAPVDPITGMQTPTPPNSRLGNIDKAMGRLPGQTVADGQFMTGKLTYLSQTGVTGLSLKHQSVAVPGNATAGGLTSTSFGAKPTLDFLLQQIQSGEDIEFGFDSHWINIIGGGKILGLPWIAFTHDQNQNKAGGNTLLTGGYGFGFIGMNNNGFMTFRGGIVDIVVAESIPEPATFALAGITLLMLPFGRCLRRV